MILLDTHIVIWILANPDELSKKAASAIRRSRIEGALAISAVTLFEIAQAIARGRIRVEQYTAAEVVNIVSRKFVVQPLTAEIAARSVEFPKDYPGDPMDRIIGATAQVHKIPLVTADRRILESGLVSTIW